MAEGEALIDNTSNGNFWTAALDQVQAWFSDSLATPETAIEITLIGVSAAVAWPISRRLAAVIHQLAEKHARYALLSRLWHNLERSAFPIVWLGIQWLVIVVMGVLDERHAALSVASSLLTAWIVIRIATAFVANHLLSVLIAAAAWIVASLNILGLFDATIDLLESASFTFGELNVTALTIIQGLIALAVLLWVTAIAGQLVEGRIRASRNLTPSMQVLTSKLMRIGLVVIAFMISLSVVGIELTAFAVFGGAIGVGLGFGLQKVFANLVSGFILLVDKSIKPGDVIAIDGDYGKVDSLGARYVSVLTRDGIEHLIPNEELITTKVENWTHSHSMLRLRKTIGVHYQSDIRKAIELCLQAADETQRVLKDPAPVCYVREFADSSVNLEVRFWIDDPMNGRANVFGALLLNVWDKFHEHEIEIPYPQRDIHLRSAAKELSGGEGQILAAAPGTVTTDLNE